MEAAPSSQLEPAFILRQEVNAEGSGEMFVLLPGAGQTRTSCEADPREVM